ncbi:hypothetical protein ACS5PK_19640 [Roseateles sp. DB2]|uniref:hypothetical protein n=1 Tax=Roseateles sp. DB2 TaxID=3453717 RepID=UPI003EEF0A4A
MYHWKKLGRPFIPQEVQGRPWLAEFAQAPATLILDDRVRVYFSCRPKPDERGQYTSFSAYVDLDRGQLLNVLDFAEQPILPLGDTGCFDEFGTYPVSVTQAGAAHVAYYAGWTRCESVPFNVAIGRAVSTDGGRTFQKTGPGPVLAYTPDEPFVISGPKIRRFNGQWWLYYIAGRKWKMVDGRAEPVYKIRMAISEDGIHWQRQHRDLIESRIEEDEAQASPDVIFSGGRYHMFFCYRHSANYRGKDGGYRIGYAHSADGLHWTRDDAQAGLAISDDGFDNEMVAYPHVFELDGKVYMAYLGNQVGRHGFGIAELQGQL